MRTKIFCYVFLLLICVCSIGVASAEPLNPIRPSVDSWTCYDHSLNYANENPDWEILTLSTSRFFYGSCHNVNYKIDGDKLIITDVSNHCNYTINNFQYNDRQYYHFWIDEYPIRNWRFLRDNRNVVM
jgi:hypothetical protein